jgi:hypothetical protein
VDAGVSSTSPKGYSERQLQEIAATVPGIYDRINEGWSENDFSAAARSNDPKTRHLGETFSRLFEDSSDGTSLVATLNGADLVVDKGNHRVMAARSIGVPVLPVWVEAPTSSDLDRIASACEERMQQEGSHSYLEAHKKIVQGRGHSWSIDGERAGTPEGFEKHRSGPEFLR